MKTRKDINYFIRTEPGTAADPMYADIYDVFLYDGKELMVMLPGIGDAKHQILCFYETEDARVHIPVTYEELRHIIPVFKADDKFIAYITHPLFGVHERNLFDVAMDRKPYPKGFEKRWDKFLEKESKKKSSKKEI
jgi:hypothetical protein